MSKKKKKYKPKRIMRSHDITPKIADLMENGNELYETYSEDDYEEDDDYEYYDDEEEDIEIYSQQILLQALNNLQNFAMERKPHIKEYKKIRNLHGEIIDGMMDYFQSGNFRQEVDTDYISEYEKANNIKNDTITFQTLDYDMETRVGIHGIQEMVIYKMSPNINCITEEFINKNRYRKPDKIEFLQSMLDSKSGLFEVTANDSKEGYSYIKEVFTGREYKITDIALSGDTTSKNMYLYTRIITYHGISFGTGLNIAFKKTDPFIKDFIKRHKKDYYPSGEFTRFAELYNRFTSNPGSIKIVGNEINKRNGKR